MEHTKYEYRISKYNSKYRRSKGDFTNDEWTSYHDIGKIFNNRIFTLLEYEYIENKYISIIKDICKYENVNNMKIVKLEDYFNKSGYCNGVVLSDINSILEVSKACLREEYWCKLNGNGVFFHFGYDYYLYVYCSLEHHIINNLAKKHELFVEQMESPYKEFGDGAF